jgi:hypothetical protein
MALWRRGLQTLSMILEKNKLRFGDYDMGLKDITDD